MKFKKLSKHGNGRALTLEKPILELLGIDDDTIMELKVEGDSLVITPIHDQDSYKRKFEQALEEVANKYQGALKQLD